MTCLLRSHLNTTGGVFGTYKETCLQTSCRVSQPKESHKIKSVSACTHTICMHVSMTLKLVMQNVCCQFTGAYGCFCFYFFDLFVSFIRIFKRIVAHVPHTRLRLLLVCPAVNGKYHVVTVVYLEFF